MQNATDQINYDFSPSLNFASAGDNIIYLDNDTYRLAIAFIPVYTIFTLTVSNITDEAGNPVTPNIIRINDNDNDDMADDWEAENGVWVPDVDPDGDALNNLEEYNNNTNPNSFDTDSDGLPDGWEVTYGLDPNDSNGLNGGSGDFDNDGWTNYEEFENDYDPTSDISPIPTPPEIVETIPHEGAGISDTARIPNNTSFSVRLQDVDGIDITDPSSIQFTITVGEDSPYTRNIGDTGVFRIIKLTSDDDTKITKLWAVYDRSKDTETTYPFDTEVTISIDAKDYRGDWMDQRSYRFKVCPHGGSLNG